MFDYYWSKLFFGVVVFWGHRFLGRRFLGHRFLGRRFLGRRFLGRRFLGRRSSFSRSSFSRHPDGLAPNHEEDESAVRQMLKKFNDKYNANLTAKGQSSDVCFRCHKQGHWAIDCPEGHEPEWLAKQNCYLCGKKGHLNVACPNKIKTDDQFKTKLKQNKPPVVKPAWHHTGTSLEKLLGNLSVKSLDDFQYYKSISSENSSNYDPKLQTKNS